MKFVLLPQRSSKVRPPIFSTTALRTAAVSLIVAFSAVGATGAQIDQENWDENPLASWWPEQQEFTPSLDKLDSVQLFMINSRVALTWPGGPCSVNIRLGGFDGPVIAASQPTYVAPHYDGPVGFGFAKPVPLIPGQLYSMEPTLGILWQGAFGTTSSPYPGGKFFGGLSGQPIGGSLVFREGIGLEVVPEPAPALLVIVGLAIAIGYSAVSQKHRMARFEPNGCSEPRDGAAVSNRAAVARRH